MHSLVILCILIKSSVKFTVLSGHLRSSSGKHMLRFSLALQTHHRIKVQITYSNMYKKPCMPPQCNPVSMWSHIQGWPLPKSGVAVENVAAPFCWCPPNGKNHDSAAQRQCLSLWIVNHFSKNPIVGLVRGIWVGGWNWEAMLVLQHQLLPPFPSNGFCASMYKMPVPVCPWQVLLGQKIVSPVAITPWNFFTLFCRGEISQMKLYFPTELQIWGISPIYISLQSVIVDARREKSETERESWQVLKLKSYWLSYLTCSFIPVLYSRKQMFNLFWIKGFNLW